MAIPAIPDTHSFAAAISYTLKSREKATSTLSNDHQSIR
jgi:hypothetical protein